MNLFRLYRSTELPISIDEAWDFFSSPKNLSKLTPPEMRFEILGGAEKRAYAGQLINYRVRPIFGIPMGWVTEITNVEEGKYFIDEQRFGPYKIWHHEHHFAETENGVQMIDDLRYGLYGGIFGSLIQKLIVGPKVEQIFAYREKQLDKIFERKAKTAVKTA
ncbi:MAG: ligand-binding SRPBCC domain-containing protein [Limisphaerales bacterium]|jgi:ligand-binding SRPBCC domain-containing protein